METASLFTSRSQVGATGGFSPPRSWRLSGRVVAVDVSPSVTSRMSVLRGLLFANIGTWDEAEPGTGSRTR